MLYSASQNSERVRAVAMIFCVLVAFGRMAAPALAAPTLDELMADCGFGKDDVRRVRDGEMIKTTRKEASDREIATVMVFLLKAPASSGSATR